MQGFTTIDLIVLIVYLGAVLFAGLRFSKKEMAGKEYFRGDGSIPCWKFLRRDMDYVVCSTWYVNCYTIYN